MYCPEQRKYSHSSYVWRAREAGRASFYSHELERGRGRIEILCDASVSRSLSRNKVLRHKKPRAAPRRLKDRKLLPFGELADKVFFQDILDTTVCPLCNVHHVP